MQTINVKPAENHDFSKLPIPKDIHALIHEVLVRFDTNPKLYQKIDFFKLIQLILYVYKNLSDVYTKEELDDLLEQFIKEAPKDGKLYARQNGDWKELNIPLNSVTDVRLDGASVVTNGVANLSFKGLATKAALDNLTNTVAGILQQLLTLDDSVDVSKISTVWTANELVLKFGSFSGKEFKVRIPVASAEQAGLMSSEDKKTLGELVQQQGTTDQAVADINDEIENIEQEVAGVQDRVAMTESRLDGIDNTLVELDNKIDTKQDILTPGENIEIIDNIISVVGEGNKAAWLDLSRYEEEDSALPSLKAVFDYKIYGTKYTTTHNRQVLLDEHIDGSLGEIPAGKEVIAFCVHLGEDRQRGTMYSFYDVEDLHFLGTAPGDIVSYSVLAAFGEATASEEHDGLMTAAQVRQLNESTQGLTWSKI